MAGQASLLRNEMTPTMYLRKITACTDLKANEIINIYFVLEDLEEGEVLELSPLGDTRGLFLPHSCETFTI